jgi:hypothetical protein
MDGSLIIEASTDKSDWDSPQQMGTSRRKWLVTPRPYLGGPPVPQKIYIAHIKVVDGSGDILFPFDNSATIDKQTQIEVTATVIKNGTAATCHVTIEGNNFTMDAPNGKKINKKQNDLPTGQVRNQRVRFMEDSPGNVDDFVFTALRIDKGPANLFNVDLTSLASKGRDLRVMLWWEELK